MSVHYQLPGAAAPTCTWSTTDRADEVTCQSCRRLLGVASRLPALVHAEVRRRPGTLQDLHHRIGAPIARIAAALVALEQAGQLRSVPDVRWEPNMKEEGLHGDARPDG